MKSLRTLLLLLLPVVASAGLVIQSGSRLFVAPSEPAEAGSLIFTGVIDEVTDRLDILVNGTAADVGAGSMTIELWLRPATSGNNEPSSVCETGVGYDFPGTNIFMDRDNTPPTVRDYGAGLAGGRVCFSIENAAGSFSVLGSTDLRDNQWHHVAVQYRASDGLIELYVDGDREASADGPNGTISLPAGCSGAGCYLVFGTEKWGFDVAGYVGAMSSIHIWDTLRYSGTTYTVPTAPIDGALGQYLMAEGSGTVVGDSAGTNDGFIAAGGVPAWSTDSPF